MGLSPLGEGFFFGGKKGSPERERLLSGLLKGRINPEREGTSQIFGLQVYRFWV
jgi:hypothetical protein